MSILSLLLAISSGVTGPSARASDLAVVRDYTAKYFATAFAKAHALIPAWARKYNMNCSGCHYPAAPRLNANGMRFKWAGYRMPDEFDESQSVEKVQNYLSVRGRFDYV